LKCNDDGGPATGIPPPFGRDSESGGTIKQIARDELRDATVIKLDTPNYLYEDNPLNSNKAGEIVSRLKVKSPRNKSGLLDCYEREANRDNRHRTAGTSNHCSNPSQAPLNNAAIRAYNGT
jgi:hypothetical protein